MIRLENKKLFYELYMFLCHLNVFFFLAGKDRRSRQPTHINLQPNVKSSHPFFHDGRAPISPIDHPKRLNKFTFDKNSSPHDQGLVIGNSFYYHAKSPSFEEDSGSTSGIHTMDEEIHSVQFQNNVV